MQNFFNHLVTVLWSVVWFPLHTTNVFACFCHVRALFELIMWKFQNETTLHSYLCDFQITQRMKRCITCQHTNYHDTANNSLNCFAHMMHGLQTLTYQNIALILTYCCVFTKKICKQKWKETDLWVYNKIIRFIYHRQRHASNDQDQNYFNFVSTSQMSVNYVSWWIQVPFAVSHLHSSGSHKSHDALSVGGNSLSIPWGEWLWYFFVRSGF